MPGKLSDGVTATRDVNLINSKAYCEGVQAKMYLESTNPHPTGSEANAAWAAGYATTPSAGLSGSCNIAAPIVVPDLVDMTIADATAALEAVDLRLGAITLTVEPIASQSPVATTPVRYGSAVNITLTS